MTRGGWDFDVQRVDLPDLSIDAGQRLGMVMVQPEYTLDPYGVVPFRISAASRTAQNGLIERAFQIRANESRERNVPIPFVLFPEAAIPVRDPDGLDCLRRQMEQAQEEVVFIGGLEGLSPQEAKEVAERLAPGVDAAGPAFAAGNFVNVCVIAVRSATGRLNWYFQAKLRPSQWEQTRNMAPGRRVLYFVGPTVAFFCQICFDHMAADGGEPLNSVLCENLIEIMKPNAATPDFVFVPQYNPKPDHMRSNTCELLNYPGRGFRSDLTAVVFVNKAAQEQESSQYGRSSLHYRAGRWQPPSSDIGPKSYELYDRERVTSVVFRKRTPGIHVATLVPASHNIGMPENPRHPLDVPRTYLIGEGCDPAPCSCLPGTECPVGRYVECDCLPCKLRDVLLRDLPKTDTKRHRWNASSPGQTEDLALHYTDIRQSLLALDCQRAVEVLKLLFLGYQDGKRNPDTWKDAPEVEGIRHLAAALSLLRERGQIEFKTAARWTGKVDEAVAVAVVDGENSSDCHDLATHYLKEYPEYASEARSTPVLIVALRSTGGLDSPIQAFEPDVTKPRTPGPLVGSSPCEPTRLRAFLCRDDLFERARRAPVLRAYLTQEMERIDG